MIRLGGAHDLGDGIGNGRGLGGLGLGLLLGRRCWRWRSTRGRLGGGGFLLRLDGVELFLGGVPAGDQCGMLGLVLLELGGRVVDSLLGILLGLVGFLLAFFRHVAGGPKAGFLIGLLGAELIELRHGVPLLVGIGAQQCVAI